MPSWDGNGMKALPHRECGQVQRVNTEAELHPAWQSIIRFCREMGYGEIARLKIHDGLPISADLVTRKIRWY